MNSYVPSLINKYAAGKKTIITYFVTETSKIVKHWVKVKFDPFPPTYKLRLNFEKPPSPLKPSFRKM